MAPNYRQLDQDREQALVARCRQQDHQAFAEIVDAYQSRVLGFVRRMVRQQDEAEDLTQEVFIRAFQAFQRFDGRSSLRTWLFRIATNLCIDRSRRTERAPEPVRLNAFAEDQELMEIPDDRWNPEAWAFHGDLSECVAKALSTMSEKLKTVLLLHDLEQLSYDEIAEAVGIPIGTVKSRLFLARNHVRTYVEEYLKEA